MLPATVKNLLLAFVLIPFLTPTFAEEIHGTRQPPATGSVWWDWNVKREWSNSQRRAWGIIKLYADAQKTKPISAELLRFSLELDCPISSGPELVLNETSGASELTAEVRCAFGSDGRFEVRWQFEAMDSVFGSVSDRGSLAK
jgi:hypothetical protein